MAKVKDILMERDGISAEEANGLISECRDAIFNGDFDAMHDYLDLEDDYIFDLLF